MKSPIYDATSVAANTSHSLPLTPRQRLETALADMLPPVTSAAAQQQDNPVKGELLKPLQRINEAMRQYGVEFHLHEHDSRIITRIVDRDSGEVIRQIPSEEVLHIAESLEQLQGRLIKLEA